MLREWALLVAAAMALGCGIAGPADDDSSRAAAGPTSGSGSGSQAGGTGVGGNGSGGSEAGTGGAGNHASGGSTGVGGGGGDGDPNCYTEPLTPTTSVSDIVNSYGGSGYKDQVINAMSRRWPAGAYLLQAQKNDPYFSQFSDSSSWSGMVGWLDTLVHEETHLFNAYHAQAQGKVHSLYFRENLIVYLPTDDGFARSQISSELDSAVAGSSYANLYLSGQQGNRGFNALLDELSCYLNEVPALSAFGEYYNGGVSLRDGSAAFLHFMQMYLKVARTSYAQYYASIQANPAYVDAVRLLWLRTHFFYQHADTHPNLGINDAQYRAAAHKPANLAEIDMFIGRKVGDSNCLLN